MKFIIHGKFVPYVRMTQRSKWVNPRARAYLASKDALAWEYRRQMNGADLFERTPLKVTIDIIMTGGLHRVDLDNQIKALMDSAQGVVFGNDCWIDEFGKVIRRLGDEDMVKIEIERIQ